MAGGGLPTGPPFVSGRYFPAHRPARKYLRATRSFKFYRVAWELTTTPTGQARQPITARPLQRPASSASSNSSSSIHHRRRLRLVRAPSLSLLFSLSRPPALLNCPFICPLRPHWVATVSLPPPPGSIATNRRIVAPCEGSRAVHHPLLFRPPPSSASSSSIPQFDHTTRPRPRDTA
jgi:hypothetical protein